MTQSTRESRLAEISKATPVYKQFAATTEPLDNRLVRFIITTSDPDRERDIVHSMGIDTRSFEANPVVLFGHDYKSLPVGRAVKLERQPNRIIATTEFATADLNPFGDQVYRMVKAGFLKATSIGFRPLGYKYNETRKGVDFHKTELLEYSIVPVPANPQALISMRAAGIDTGVLKSWAQRTLDVYDDDDEVVLRFDDDESETSPRQAELRRAIRRTYEAIARSETRAPLDRTRAQQDEQRFDVDPGEVAALVRDGFAAVVREATEGAISKLRGRID